MPPNLLQSDNKLSWFPLFRDLRHQDISYWACIYSPEPISISSPGKSYILVAAELVVAFAFEIQNLEIRLPLQILPAFSLEVSLGICSSRCSAGRAWRMRQPWRSALDMVLLLPLTKENQDWSTDKWEQGLLLPFLLHSPGLSTSSLCLPSAPSGVPVPFCLPSSTASDCIRK